jgi:hypothetical protein
VRHRKQSALSLQHPASRNHLLGQSQLTAEC